MFKCMKCSTEYAEKGEGECKACGSSLVSVVKVKEEEVKKPEKKGK